MYAPLLQVPAFEALDDPARRRVLYLLLEVLAAVNIGHLEQHPEVPPLYRSGVRYVERVPCISAACECWCDLEQVLAQGGKGNCKELSAWRVAELYARKRELARFTLSLEESRLPDGATLHTYHVRVVRADGRVEDPSRVLGMR